MSEVPALVAAVMAQQESVQAQQQSIEQLTEVIGGMTQIVAMLLGEELGTPAAAPDVDDVETDMDGNPIR